MAKRLLDCTAGELTSLDKEALLDSIAGCEGPRPGL